MDHVQCFGNKKVPVRMSNTSTEIACLKLIFTKFICSMKKASAIRRTVPTRRPCSQNGQQTGKRCHICVSRVVDDANVLWSRASVCLCVSVCVPVRGRMPTLPHGPGCNLW